MIVMAPPQPDQESRQPIAEVLGKGHVPPTLNSGTSIAEDEIRVLCLSQEPGQVFESITPIPIAE
jgi:hypothetical protein